MRVGAFVDEILLRYGTGFDELAVRPVDSDVEATFWSLTRHLENGAAIGRLGEAVAEVYVGHAYVVHILSTNNVHYMRAICIRSYPNDEARFYLFDIGTSVQFFYSCARQF